MAFVIGTLITVALVAMANEYLENRGINNDKN